MAIGGWTIAPAARAMLYMFVSAGLITSVDACTKYMIREGLHPIEIVFFRNLFGTLALAPVYIRLGVGALRTDHRGQHIIRNLAGAVAVISYFWALAYMPIVQAAVLGFMSPIYTAIGAILFLREPSRIMRWVSIGLGLVGMVIIVRPGTTEFNLGFLLIAIANVGGATARLMTKSLSRTDSASTIVVYASMTIVVATFIPALFFWQWPTLEQWVILVIIGAVGSAGQVLMTAALRYADVTVAEPVTYTRLLWAAGIGFVAFAELPDLATWIGGLVIIAGAILLLRSEARRAPPVGNPQAVK